MNYKVCILAAGINRKIGPVADKINAAILPVDSKGTISHIIEKFHESVEIIIAIGHQKESLRDYVKIAHPGRKFTFVEIEQFIGPGTGPGHTLLQCKNYLQTPFILSTADTIVLEEVPTPDKNWFGIAPVKKTEDYCTVKIKNNFVVQLDDKVKTDNKLAFIGLAGIYNYQEFFQELERNKELKQGELQVSNGFRKLIEKKLVPIGFTWFDTGSKETYTETNKNFSGGNKNFDFSKFDEFLYFVNDRVIKFFVNPETTEQRCLRADHLKGICPEIVDKKGGFYAYKHVEGQVLYNVLNSQVASDFFEWCKLNLWKKKELSHEEQDTFKQACRIFYYDKTIKRLNLFYEKTGIDDTESSINGVTVPPLKELLGGINWEGLFKGIPSNFHGDLQFDNIIVSHNMGTNLPKFTLIDWRHNFGGSTEVGDVYYDLAKMYGGMTISYQGIKKGNFSFDMSGSSSYYNFSIENSLVEAREEYEEFLKRNKYDFGKIKILRSLIFLNMSPLHHSPFDKMLYFKGKLLLHRALKEQQKKGEVNICI